MKERLAVTLIVLLAVGSPAAAQTWIELTTIGGPSGLDFHGFDGDSVAYDPAANRLIVFLPRSIGFANHFFPESDPTGQVWVLSHANGLGGTPTWTQLTASGSPLPAIHSASTSIYDQTNERLIVYGGGFFHSSPPLNGTFVLTDANGLGGTPTWSLLPAVGATCSPFGQAGSCTGANDRLQNSSVYDPISGRMISFGGHIAFFFTAMNDTRVLTNANGLGGSPTWQTLAASGSPPAVRATHTSVYDEGSNRMIVFGGWDTKYPSPNLFYNDLRILDNANGVSGSPTWLPVTAPGGPSPRGSHSAVYDPINNRMIVYGGRLDPSSGPSVFFDDVWELSDANGLTGTPSWTPLAPSGTGPGPVAGHGAVFDAQSQRMIVFAGVPDASGIAQTRVFVLSFSQDVDIDIKPGSYPNSINPKSQGVIPVAILTTASFDATTVDPASVRFGPGGAAEAHGTGHIEDVDGDGDNDMVLHFRTQATGIECGATSASLTGQTLGGQPIEGIDSVRTVGCS